MARSAVSGIRRLPSPPASTIASTFGCSHAPTLTTRVRLHQPNAAVRARVTIVRRLMRVDLLTREYPPEVYGGAGVHVSTSPASCAAWPTSGCTASARRATSRASPAYAEPAGLAGANAALRTLGVDLAMAAGCAGTDLVHSHTWYANLAGHVAKLLHGVPHVVTAHSLEPLRPWKAEQLGGGYALSSWCERTALEARRRGHRRVGRDAARRAAPRTRRSTRTGSGWSTTASTPSSTPPTAAPTCSTGYGIDPDRPSVVFVGRITRQKGLPYLLRAARSLPPDGAARAAAPARRTPPEIAAEVDGAGRRAAARPATAWSGSRRCCPSPRSSRCSRTPRSSSARRSTSRWASSTWRRWPARRPSWPPRPAASRRSSPTARPGCWSRSSRPPTAPAPRWTRTGSSPTWPRRSTSCSPTRSGPRRWAGPAARARWSTSPGRRSPNARSTSTARYFTADATTCRRRAR